MLTSLGLLMLIAIGALLSMRVFTISRIEVEGCVLRDPAEVRDLSGIAVGDSIFRINNAQTRANVEQSPYYTLDRIELLLPDGVMLAVTERQPHAVINYLNALIVMDENGLILDIAQQMGNARCPVVTGMEVSSFQVGQAVESYAPEQVTAMNAVLREILYQDCQNVVSEINVSDTINLRLYLVNGLSVKMGSINGIREKVRWMRGAVAEIERRGLGIGELDVSSGKLATFLPDSALAGITINTEAAGDNEDTPADAQDGDGEDIVTPQEDYIDE